MIYLYLYYVQQLKYNCRRSDFDSTVALSLQYFYLYSTSDNLKYTERVSDSRWVNSLKCLH